MVGVYYALLSRHAEAHFEDIRAAVASLDGPASLLQSTDALSIRRGDGAHVMLRSINLRQGDSSPHYKSALLFRFDLDNIPSAALVWEVLIAVSAEGDSYDVWNAAYPAQKIAKCAELRPLKLLGTCGYVMRPAEFNRLAEQTPG